MKYSVILTDGAADYPVPELDGKTPFEVAKKPCIDALAKKSELGMLHVTPDGCKGGSEIGNLCVMGYDPRVYLTGRSPLEARSLGIEMSETDLALRCNLVTLSVDEPYEQKTMVDNTASEISTEDAKALMEDVQKEFGSELMTFYAGISYKHCLIMHNATDKMSFTPPHNIIGKSISEYLPKGDYCDLLLDIQKRSFDFLTKHPINAARVAKGLNPANSLWLWGQGRRMSLPSFESVHGISGAAVTAVDLIKGIALCADMSLVDVDGATGNLHSNFDGKARTSIDWFKKGVDLVYTHLEAPDECGHQGDVAGKIRSIEIIDEKIVKPIYEYLVSTGEDFRILITPDHPTPLTTRGHASDDVPYMIYRSDREVDGTAPFCERICAETGNFIDEGFHAINRMMKE